MKVPKVIDKKELAHLEYEVLIDSNKQSDAGQWCEKQFGSRWSPITNRSGQWAMFWGGNLNGKYRFCFANEEDMIWFMLRWQ